VLWAAKIKHDLAVSGQACPGMGSGSRDENASIQHFSAPDHPPSMRLTIRAA
jgi:hypothetical protein